MAPVEGIEPPLTVLETVALPLYYTGIKFEGSYYNPSSPTTVGHIAMSFDLAVPRGNDPRPLA